MKNGLMKKLLAGIAVLSMIMAMGTPVFAQSVDSEKGGQGSITISNASRGIKYTIKKIFTATYNKSTNTIAYTYDGTLPTNEYFTQAENGSISATDKAISNGNLTEEATGWLKDHVTGEVIDTYTDTDGGPLKITGLQYGYYMVTSDLGTGAAISLDSTKPTAVMYDKNEDKPHITDDQGKKVDDTDKIVKVGQKLTYTVSFTAANYDGSGTGAKKISSYTIADTLPEFLSDVNVTSITIGDQDYKVDGVTPQFSTDKKITIPWVDDNGNSLYATGSVITITYTAVVDDDVTIAGEGNTNDVTITWNYMDGTTPENKKITDEETVYSFAFALQKVSNTGVALPGATFRLPFFVKQVGNDYVYAGEEAGEGLTNEVTTPDTGVIVVKGVTTDPVTITETEAPEGYNKLDDSFTVTPVMTKAVKTVNIKYLDDKGNVTDEKTDTAVVYNNDDLAATVEVVVNKAGSVLPSTGGMGTTVFYLAGGILVIGAGVILVTRKRLSK